MGRVSLRVSEVGINIVQANRGRGMAATTELLLRAEEEGVDILLIQEPYTYRGQVSGLGKFSRQVVAGNGEGETAAACICIVSKEYTATALCSVNTSHCVAAHVVGSAGSLYVVSLYCQYSHEIAGYLRQLERVCAFIGRAPVLVAADANAASPLWCRGLLESDSRAMELEDSLAMLNMVMLNTLDQPRTYVRGDRDIDVTLASEEIVRLLKSWSVKEDWLSSDHRAIFISLDEEHLMERVQEPRYNVARANWDRYRAEVDRWSLGLQEFRVATCQDEELLAERVEEILLRAARRSIPKKKEHSKSVPWWTRDLSELKRRVNR